MPRETLAAHFHEIALKGKNRRRFEAVLRDNLRKVLRPLGGDPEVRSVESRLLIELPDGVDVEEALDRVRNVFGIAHCFRVDRVPHDLDRVGQLVTAAVRERAPANFRILTRRNDKSFPKNSVEVDRYVGAIVHEATGVPVKLAGSEMVVYVLVLADGILVATDKRAGVGGLPVGTGGRVAVLLSGGIDSPVAAYRMMKRGLHTHLIHFHSHPLVDRKSIEKAQELAERLTRWQYQTRLYLVPLAEIQTAARLHAPERLRVILYRRFMFRIAQAIARRNRCRALVTGESVGQVASQTLVNLATVDAVVDLPVLRPLIGMDKQEIVDQAERINTFEVSVEPDQDCCKLFLPKHPAVAATDAECTEAEASLDVEGLVSDALHRTEVEMLRWPA